MTGSYINVQPHQMERKLKKPLMEKRRRARINRCLNDLKSLLMQSGPAAAKLEKADILEMTVKHLRLHQTSRQVSDIASARQHFAEGYQNAMQSIGQFLQSSAASSMPAGDRRTLYMQMLPHLHNSLVNNLDRVLPAPVAHPIPCSPLQHPVPVPHSTPFPFLCHPAASSAAPNLPMAHAMQNLSLRIPISTAQQPPLPNGLDIPTPPLGLHPHQQLQQAVQQQQHAASSISPHSSCCSAVSGGSGSSLSPLSSSDFSDTPVTPKTPAASKQTAVPWRPW